MNAQSNLRYAFFYALLLGVATVTFLMFLPYLVTLAVAATFAVMLQPLYRYLKKLCKGKEAIAALLTMLLSALVLIGPLTLMGVQVTREAADLYERIGSGTDIAPGTLIGTIEEMVKSFVQGYVPEFDLDLQSIVRQSLGSLSLRLGSVFASTVQSILHIVLGIIAFFYLLKDGDDFLSVLVDLSPLSDRYDEQIIARLKGAISSIIKGSLLIAILQGAVSGIGFGIFGVPSAALWGMLAAIGALIPGVGTSIVIIPAVLYLFFTGQTAQAIGMAIWGATAVGLIDNLLGPVLVGRGVRIHPLLILFSVIGGLQFFGPVGFILGPLLLSLLYALLDIYRLIATGEGGSKL